MYGFYIYIKSELESSFEQNLNDKQTIKFGDYRFYYKKFDKFNGDKIFQETEKYIIGLDGVILNLKSLKKVSAKSDPLKLVCDLFEKEGIAFISNFKGEFSGFIFKKATQTLYFFNNKTATKQVFYSKVKNAIIISPTVDKIVEFRREEGDDNKLSISNAYTFLTFGGMVEDETLVQDIYKLGAGEFLTIKDLNLKVDKYFDFNNIKITISNKNKAIESLNEVFIEAVKSEYEKDKEYNYDHIATLSGGLDSRMNVMIANKLGYKPKTFCFSQSNYDDDAIARKISKDLSLDHIFIPLNGGDYLKSLSEMVSINNGLQYYHGSAHLNYAIQQIDISSYGLMHTGQIGDAILGGMVSKDKNYLSKTISNRFIDKVSIKKSVLNSYRDEEVFKLYQRIFNLTNFGSYTLEHNKTYLVSPFLDDDVINISLSIHPDLKFNQDIYIDWLTRKHPEVTKYIWERTGFKPHKRWLTELARYTKKIRKEYLILTNQLDKLSMNPTDHWLKANASIQEFYKHSFQSNIELVRSNTELFNDLNEMYNEGKLTEKALVLTMLEAINKFELKV